jgi:hypothetical protein
MKSVSEMNTDTCILMFLLCETVAIYKNCFRAYAKMAASSNQYVGGGTKTVGMFSKLVSQGSSFVMEGVKNLVIKRHVSSVF